MGVFSAPIEELQCRIRAHAEPGGLLDGYRTETTATAYVSGEKDLPAARMYCPSITEIPRGRVITGSMEIIVQISTKRTEGIPKHIEAVEAVMDALETNVAGQIDPGLGGSLRCPMTIKSGNANILDLSITSDLSLTLEARPAERGQRSAGNES